MSDGHRAKTEPLVPMMVVVGIPVPALQAMREQTARVKSMSVYQTLVKTKALAL